HWPGLTEIQQMPQSKAKKYAWLIEAIKNTARRPFYTNSWVGIGHTTQARSTPQGTDELRFCMRQGFGGGSHELFHRILRRGLHEGVCQTRPWLT
ncbi:MAG TPA: hypothetical protein H9884_00970, partial [Candidatus Yaniella excrementigallinarum]|nr:hypothetical protein [Candidatus Yaniella excrementigallinarum]